MENAVKEEIAIVAELNQVASKHPYYKYVRRLAHFACRPSLMQLLDTMRSGLDLFNTPLAPLFTVVGSVASDPMRSLVNSAAYSLSRKSEPSSQVTPARFPHMLFELATNNTYSSH